jgi:hypothetical protein
MGEDGEKQYLERLPIRLRVFGRKFDLMVCCEELIGFRKRILPYLEKALEERAK